VVQANAQGGVAGAGRTFERVSVVKALAGRKVPAFVAHGFSPAGAELVIVERYSDAPSLDQLERDARAAMALRHPNVATVRDVWREGSELCVAMEYVEGETLEELRRVGAGGKEFSIEVGVRVIVDVLAALSAIHTHGQGTAHGEVTATNVIVGFDGTTRLVRPFHGHVAGKVAEPDWFSYVAPEVVKGGTADVRADLYAVGVLLWETLSRRKLFPKATRDGRAARSMPVGKPSPPPDAGWAATLGAVTDRALSNEPTARYTTASEMAAAVRLAVRSKLAMPVRVSAAVDKLASERILARRNANALPDPSAEPRISARPSRPSVPPEAVRALSALRPSSRPPTPKPGPVAMPVIPKTPPLPSLGTPRPRPIAPAIAIAPPVPKPASIRPPPAEILDASLVESVREPVASPIAQAAPIVTPMPTPVPIIEPVVPGVAVDRRRRAIWISVAVFCVLIALAAVVRLIAGSGSETPQAGSAHPSAKAPETATVTATATTTTATPTTSAAETATAPASATAESSATGEPDPTSTSTTAPVDSSHHPHTRPRPTYDPMGI
jgi:serine/threonine protein kinase